MSATLSGLIILENARPVDGSPTSVTFDGQMWLAPGHILTGEFRYYNSNNDSFSEVGQYFAWIHIAKFFPLSHMQHTNNDGDGEGETEQEIKEWQTVEDIVKTDDPTSLESPEEPADVLHVIGDIIRLIPINTENMRHQAYINISGAVVNSNKTDGFFQVNAAQYTSYYKNNRALSILPIQAHFNLSKYKTKKPIPSNNTYVSVEGFLEEIETDSSGHATRFHVSVDNISFLGKATFSPPAASNSALGTPSRSSRFKFNFESSTPGYRSDSSGPSTPTKSVMPISAAGTSTRGGKRKK